MTADGKNKNSRCKARAIALAMLLAAGALSVQAQTTAPEPAAIKINIAAQPLALALAELTRQFGLKVDVAPALVADRSAPALTGRFTARQAIDRLLAGSGLEGVQQQDGSFTVRRVGAAAARVEPAPPTSQEALLPQVRVRERRDEPFVAPDAPGVSRTDAPLRDIPASIQVVPRAVIDELQALRLDEALRNVSGVIFSDGGEGTNFQARGFGITTFRDGLRRTEFTGGDVNRADQDTYNVERIEVLKGPASALFGRSNSGGLINIVTKRPRGTPVGTAFLTVGSFGLWRGAIDVGTAVNTTQPLGVRINAAYEQADSFRDQVDSQRTLVAPSLAWQLNTTTRLSFFGEYARVKQTPDVGLPRAGNQLVAGVPTSRFLGEAATDRSDSDIAQGRLLLEKEAGNWLFKGLVEKGTIENREYFTRGGALQANGRTVTRSIIDSAFKSDDQQGQIEALGKLRLLGLAHRVTLGVDAGERKTDSRFTSAPANPIDLFNPVYGNTGPTGPFFIFRQPLTQTFYGAFAHDTITLAEQWKLALGARWDHFKQEPQAGFITTLPTRKYEKVSPRAGIVYQPTSYLSFYTAYDRSFQAPNGFPLQFGGTPLEPQRSMLKEVGVKAEWLGGRLVSTAAVYRIDRTNVGTPDLQNPGFQVPLGEQRSEGFEIDLAGEITSGWRVLAGYAFTDAVILRDTGTTQGKTLPGVPSHTVSLWTSYEFQSAWLRGLGFGVGAYHVGERQGNASNTFQTPAYNRYDAAVFYKMRSVTARLNVFNLTDREILLNPTRATFFAPGAPRTLRATIEWRFL